MEGINGIGAAKHAHQMHQSSNSRRPGTAGHPGKHLGHFKHMSVKPDTSSMPVIQQLLNSMASDNGKGSDKTGGVAQNNIQPKQSADSNYQIALDALRDTNNSISDQLSFTSRFNAITTVY